MSWNEPGDSDKDRKNDPWSNNRPNNEEGPPDLEELFKKLQIKLSGSFGGKGSPPPSGKGSGSGIAGMGLIVFLLLAVYVISGIFLVQPAERAVITRFGQYHATLGPGPHWMPRFIDKKTIVDIEAIQTTRQGGHMLTRDENIVNVELAIQYRILSPEDYLFNDEQPEYSLAQVTNSALRYVVGHTTLDEVITRGRAEVAQSIRMQVSETLDSYGAGLEIVEVAMQPATPPEEVKNAFDDVIRAREDEQRYVNEADAYARKIEPIAEGKARRMLEEAQGYKEREVLLATGETQRFLALIPKYRMAPGVMEDRMYFDTMETVLGETPKVLVDSDGSNLMMLPLGDILNQAKPGRSVRRLDESDMLEYSRNGAAAAQPNVRQSARSVRGQ